MRWWRWLVVVRWEGQAEPVAGYWMRWRARSYARRCNQYESDNVIYTVERIIPACQESAEP